MKNIVIYKADDGHIEIDVSLENKTLWLSLRQISELFARDKSVISRHLANIFKSKELSKNRTVAKYATVQKEGQKEVSRDIDYYNLDAIISVGYRVNSIEGTKFRKWATDILTTHLLKGYTLREKRIAELGITELQQSIDLLQQTLINNELVNDMGLETMKIISNYSKAWYLLLAFDEDKLIASTNDSDTLSRLDYQSAVKAIKIFKLKLEAKGESTSLLGNERNNGFKGLLGNIEQTFAGECLYRTIEERAAHLLYFIIKDHPFSDGNKRIGCLMFLIYLNLQKVEININDNGLVALALLVAESCPKQKDLIIKLIMNMLYR